MKKLTNGKHIYPPKNSLVEYSKDHFRTWETITETQPAVDIVDLIGKYAFGEVRKQ
jgi:hypothetical protein